MQLAEHDSDAVDDDVTDRPKVFTPNDRAANLPDVMSAKGKPSLMDAIANGEKKSRSEFGGGDVPAKNKEAVI
jgi:hypothetical protein